MLFKHWDPLQRPHFCCSFLDVWPSIVLATLVRFKDTCLSPILELALLSQHLHSHTTFIPTSPSQVLSPLPLPTSTSPPLHLPPSLPTKPTPSSFSPSSASPPPLLTEHQAPSPPILSCLCHLQSSPSHVQRCCHSPTWRRSQPSPWPVELNKTQSNQKPHLTQTNRCERVLVVADGTADREILIGWQWWQQWCQRWW